MIFHYYKIGENKKLEKAAQGLYNCIYNGGYLQGYSESKIVHNKL